MKIPGQLSAEINTQQADDASAARWIDELVVAGGAVERRVEIRNSAAIEPSTDRSNTGCGRCRNRCAPTQSLPRAAAETQAAVLLTAHPAGSVMR
jgi:hypothetical protein